MDHHFLCIPVRIGLVWATPTLTPEKGLPLRLPSRRQPKTPIPQSALPCSLLLPLQPVVKASPQNHHRQENRIPTQPKVKRSREFDLTTISHYYYSERLKILPQCSVTPPLSVSKWPVPPPEHRLYQQTATGAHAPLHVFLTLLLSLLVLHLEARPYT